MSIATEDHQPAYPSSSLRHLVARHPVAAFLIMVYAIGWFTLIAAAGQLGLPMLLASSLAMVLGLALPAFLVTAATSGKAGVRNLLRRIFRWRVGIQWYPLRSPRTHAQVAPVSATVPVARRPRRRRWSPASSPTVYLP